MSTVATPTQTQKCDSCGRERDPITDLADYSPMQALINSAYGWYSGDDGEICPQCITQIMRGGR